MVGGSWKVALGDSRACVPVTRSYCLKHFFFTTVVCQGLKGSCLQKNQSIRQIRHGEVTSSRKPSLSSPALESTPPSDFLTLPAFPSTLKLLSLSTMCCGLQWGYPHSSDSQVSGE